MAARKSHKPAKTRNTAKRSRKSAKPPKKAAKLGYKIAVTMPTAGHTRKADITILNTHGPTATTDRGDLADGRERTRLGNKLTKLLHKGTPQQWEAALQQAHIQALKECDEAEKVARENPPPPCSPCSPGS